MKGNFILLLLRLTKMTKKPVRCCLLLLQLEAISLRSSQLDIAYTDSSENNTHAARFWFPYNMRVFAEATTTRKVSITILYGFRVGLLNGRIWEEVL